MSGDRLQFENLAHLLLSEVDRMFKSLCWDE